MSGFAQRIFIAHEERGVHVVAEAGEVALGMAAEYEADITRGKAASSVWKSLLHECVVTQVGVGVGNNGEEDYDRETELVAEVDGKIESGIVMSPLGALHPVNDAAAIESL
jgi:hypothetical protein